jgi:hypothetical protein
LFAKQVCLLPFTSFSPHATLSGFVDCPGGLTAPCLTLAHCLVTLDKVAGKGVTTAIVSPHCFIGESLPVWSQHLNLFSLYSPDDLLIFCSTKSSPNPTRFIFPHCSNTLSKTDTTQFTAYQASPLPDTFTPSLPIYTPS